MENGERDEKKCTTAWGSGMSKSVAQLMLLCSVTHQCVAKEFRSTYKEVSVESTVTKPGS